MGVATTEFRVHKCKINKDLDYGLRWSEPATALSYKLRQRAMRAANEASVRSTCRMPAISFAFEWSLNLLTVFLNIWSCYFLNDVLRAAITFEPLHFPVHAKLNTQYSRNTSNSFGHMQAERPLCYSQSGRSACMWFFPSAQKQSRPLSKHKPPDLLTNAVSCSLRLKKTLTVCLLWPLPGQNGNPPDLISLTNY